MNKFIDDGYFNLIIAVTLGIILIYLQVTPTYSCLTDMCKKLYYAGILFMLFNFLVFIQCKKQKRNVREESGMNREEVEA